MQLQLQPPCVALPAVLVLLLAGAARGGVELVLEGPEGDVAGVGAGVGVGAGAGAGATTQAPIPITLTTTPAPVPAPVGARTDDHSNSTFPATSSSSSSPSSSIPTDSRSSVASTRLSVVPVQSRAAWLPVKPLSSRLKIIGKSTAPAPSPSPSSPHSAWPRGRRHYRTVEPNSTTPSPSDVPDSTRRGAAGARAGGGVGGRAGGRAVWSLPSAAAAAAAAAAASGSGSATSAVSSETSTEYYYSKRSDPYKKYPGKYVGDYNASLWTSLHNGLPMLGSSGAGVAGSGWPTGGGGGGSWGGNGGQNRRSSHHKHAHHREHQHQPFVAVHWEDADYGDYAAGGSQVVPLSHGHGHQGHPVYYVGEQKQESSWNDLTTKLIILAVIKLLIVKALGIGAFKLFALAVIKVPIALAAIALKFAVFVKFFKFIKVLIALIVVPVIVVAILPLLIPLALLLIPLLLIPLLLLFPVPVLTGGASGGTVVTVTPGRKRREEEEQTLLELEQRVMDSRRCLQKLACDMGSTSQSVKSYAGWVIGLLDFVKPLLGDNKRLQLKSYVAAYKSGLSGRSCYRKYPCYLKRMAAAWTRAAASRGEGGADLHASTLPDTHADSDSNSNSQVATDDTYPVPSSNLAAADPSVDLDSTDSFSGNNTVYHSRTSTSTGRGTGRPTS